MAKSKEDLEEIVQNIIDGTSTEEEHGLALKTLQNGLSASMLSQVSGINKNMQILNTMVSDAVAQFMQQYEANKDLMDMKTLMQFIDNVQNRQVKILELNRRISQGTQLFNTETLSEDEKMIRKLFKSFRTNDEKRRFMALVAKELSGQGR